MSDPINHPSHYTFGRFEVIDVIEDWALPYSLSNVIKYVARWDKKGDPLENLKKAEFYLKREIAKLENPMRAAQAPANSPLEQIRSQAIGAPGSSATDKPGPRTGAPE